VTADPVTLARRVETLARFLRDRGLRAEALAGENIAAELRALAHGPGLCPVCKHRHSIGTDCCTLCGWRTVRP
jgi:hypothetical protein